MSDLFDNRAYYYPTFLPKKLQGFVWQFYAALALLLVAVLALILIGIRETRETNRQEKYCADLGGYREMRNAYPYCVDDRGVVITRIEEK